jgi:hypothetical protein
MWISRKDYDSLIKRIQFLEGNVGVVDDNSKIVVPVFYGQKKRMNFVTCPPQPQFIKLPNIWKSDLKNNIHLSHLLLRKLSNALA